uniref:HTH araC/xylS-type domain-containing protein n=1 Tax=Serratia proteamaculans (strain 568) TaxID=399741 RepID=A8G8I3_SERP5
MRLAGHWIIHDKISIDTVALRLGYASQAALSKAFSASMDIHRALCGNVQREALIK